LRWQLIGGAIRADAGTKIVCADLPGVVSSKLNTSNTLAILTLHVLEILKWAWKDLKTRVRTSCCDTGNMMPINGVPEKRNVVDYNTSPLCPQFPESRYGVFCALGK
jgi:hypothetical protein